MLKVFIETYSMKVELVSGKKMLCDCQCGQGNKIILPCLIYNRLKHIRCISQNQLQVKT